MESLSTQKQLKWTNLSLAVPKNLFSWLTAASFAFCLLLKDPFFAYSGLLFLAFALLYAAIQLGLVVHWPWARIAAIILSALQIPSLAAPLAILSLKGLLNRTVTDEFRRRKIAAEPITTLLWRLNRLNMIICAIVFFGFIAEVLTVAQIKKHSRKEVRSAVISSSILPTPQTTSLSER